MFERFTEHARQVVVRAQTHAREIQHAEITTGDLLIGNGPAAKVSAPDALSAAKLYNARYAAGSGDRVYVAEHARAFEASTTLEEIAGA